MTDHEKFKALIDKLGLSRQELADMLGMKFTSVTNQLAPSKDLPKWAKSMLIVANYNPFNFFDKEKLWEEMKQGSTPISKEEFLYRFDLKNKNPAA